ncbi:MAG: Dabb family protein [Cyclobacteriaceae bacterium]|nr:Dabb family protein [Cyclobacteriaceae bacterium]
MVKHVVMWKFRQQTEDNSAEENKTMLKQKLEELPAVIKEIDSLEVGQNFTVSPAAYEMVLITTHKDREALKAYQVHPKHQEVVAFVSEVASDRVVVDFEF